MCLSCKNQFIDLHCKSMEWFLYDRNLRHERVNEKLVMLVSLISWPLFTSGNLSRKSLKNHAIAIFIFLNWLFDNWRHSKNELLISHCFQKCIFIRSANNNALLTAIVNKIEILSAIVAQISAMSLFFSQLEEVNFSKNDFLWQLATFHHYYLLLSLKKR